MDERDIRQWCMFMHLAQFAGYVVPLAGIVAPIVMWQTKKDESPEIDAHGRLVANAILSYMCYVIASLLLCLVLIGFVLLPIVAVCAIAFPIVGAVKASDGELWKYPFVIEFL
ncbi:MAG: DUF4870 domain-containing protein [Planctomycetota bacterium]